MSILAKLTLQVQSKHIKILKKKKIKKKRGKRQLTKLKNTVHNTVYEPIGSFYI